MARVIVRKQVGREGNLFSGAGLYPQYGMGPISPIHPPTWGKSEMSSRLM